MAKGPEPNMLDSWRGENIESAERAFTGDDWLFEDCDEGDDDVEVVELAC